MCWQISRGYLSDKSTPGRPAFIAGIQCNDTDCIKKAEAAQLRVANRVSLHRSDKTLHLTTEPDLVFEHHEENFDENFVVRTTFRSFV